MTMPAFHSSLAQAMTDLVTFKRMEGFDYTAQAKFLEHFDAFLCKHGYDQTRLNQQIVEAYIEYTANQAANGRCSRLSIVRVLSRYLHQLDAESYVLHELPVKRPSLPRWYLYSPEDIATLMRHAKTLSPAGSLRPHYFYMLIGLLYVTGLRIGEALALNLADVDTRRRLLFVRKGKFGKERYVVLHHTTIQAVGEYLTWRTLYEPCGENSPFFLSSTGRRLEYRSTAKIFRQMVRSCGVGYDAPHPPRLHDIRHTYAYNCLLKWYREGDDVNSMLPILATAMGHANIASTQIYLHVTSQLLEQALQRFHGTFTFNCKGD